MHFLPRPYYTLRSRRRQRSLSCIKRIKQCTKQQAVVFKGKTEPRRGQAAVEYILLVAFMSLIFGAVFTGIRQNLFNLWVCEMAPRIQSPIPCNEGSKCLGYAGDSDTKEFCY